MAKKKSDPQIEDAIKAIEEKREKMVKAANYLSEFFPDKGFLLVTFPFGKYKIADYISNGGRLEMVSSLRLLADHLEKNKKDLAFSD